MYMEFRVLTYFLLWYQPHNVSSERFQIRGQKHQKKKKKKNSTAQAFQLVNIRAELKWRQPISS